MQRYKSIIFHAMYLQIETYFSYWGHESPPIALKKMRLLYKYTTHKCGEVLIKKRPTSQSLFCIFYVTMYFPKLYSLLENCNKKEDRNYNKIFLSFILFSH